MWRVAPYLREKKPNDANLLTVPLTVYQNGHDMFLPSVASCCIHCLLGCFCLSVTLPWLTPPILSFVTPLGTRAEFTFFTNPLSSATKMLSSPDQNRPVDTSRQVPEHSLSSSAPVIGLLRRKICSTERREQEERPIALVAVNCHRL